MRKRARQELRTDIADRDRRISALERSHWRLQHLYDISKLLTPFEPPERTVPEVVALVAQTVPLRSAIFIWETVGVPRVITWQAEGESAEGLRTATARAQQTYAYLARSHRDVVDSDLGRLELPQLPAAAVQARADAQHAFLSLPIVVRRGSIFGSLQVEGSRPLEEPDLVFINAVVNQLAIALDRQSTEQALRASQQRLAGIVSTAADAIISVSEAGSIVMYNEGAVKIFGWLPDEVLGKPLDMLLPERVRQRHRRHIASFAASPETARKMGARSLATHGLRKSGEEFPAGAAISKLNVGGTRLFTVVLRDITEQIRVEHEERFLAEVGEVLATTLDAAQTLSNLTHVALAEFADVCIVEFVDEHGELRMWDVAASDPSKTAAAEALKHFPLDRSRPHLTSTIVQSKQPQLLAEIYPETIRTFAQSEEHRWLWETIAPTSLMGVPLIIRGELVGTCVVGQCGTGRRYGSADLRLLEAVGRRAASALENARLFGAAQRAIQARDEVLGVVAHDLRGPLQTIRMQAALLRRIGPQPRPDSVTPAEVIERAAARMQRLVQDLLDVTRMEHGILRIECSRVLAGQLVQDSALAQGPLAAASSLELELDIPPELPQVWADRDRLLQVFENLVVNAIKFSAPGGRVTVGTRPREGSVLFWVADTGSGIPPDDLPQLFDRFWQARPEERRGTGLGLTIVKGIVEAHGGRIWVESVPGRGSTFYFTVPVAADARAFP